VILKASTNNNLNPGARAYFGAGGSFESAGGSQSWTPSVSIWARQSIVSGTYIVAHSGSLNGSDDTIKSEETPIESATETLLKLTPKNYFKHPEYRVDEGDESPIPEKDASGNVIEKFWESGVIAQDILKIPELGHLVGFSPDLVSGDGILAVNYTGLIPFLVKSNQELHARIVELEKTITGPSSA